MRSSLRRSLLGALTLCAILPQAPAFAQSAPAADPARTRAEPPAAPAPRTSGPPNIVLILVDDFGVEGINAYGGEYYTPNVDRLAAQGTRFDNAHAMPLCSPSRVRLMTGQENWRNYEAFGYLAPGQRTFANVLKEAGFTTGIVGKWQLMGNGFDGRTGITPTAAGFDESYLWQLQALTPKGSRYWGPTRAANGTPKISEEGFGPDNDQAFALDFIARNQATPFFLYYSMVLTHSPFVPTPDSLTATGAKNRFAGMVTYMDRQVGELMAALKARGLDSNTLVIFTGDNGTARQITTLRHGYPVRGGKGSPTVNGTHVPFIVAGPGVPSNRVSPALVDFADVLPTMAEAAGRPELAGKVDGVSQWNVFTGKAARARDTIFQHYAPQWLFEPARFVFDANWKLYGDGRFVSIDAISGEETEVPPARRTGEAAKRFKVLSAELAAIKDGPLNPERFPWCRTQASSVPGKPAIEAGCEKGPSGDE